MCMFALFSFQVAFVIKNPHDFFFARWKLFCGEIFGAGSRFANWSPPCRVLVDNISEWFSLFFLVYRHPAKSADRSSCWEFSNLDLDGRVIPHGYFKMLVPACLCISPPWILPCLTAIDPIGLHCGPRGQISKKHIREGLIVRVRNKV